MRRFAATANMAATLGIGENLLVVAGYLLRILRVLLLLAVWRALFAGRGEVGGLALQQVLTYTVVASAFNDQIEARTGLSWSIWEGTVNTRLLRPVPVFADYLAEAVGTWLFRLVTFTVPVLLLAPLIGVRTMPADTKAGGLFVISLLLAIAVGVAIDFLWGTLVVWLDQSLWSIEMSRSSIASFLGGAVIPLPLLPGGLGDVFALLPFASMASAPLLIFVGHEGAKGLLLLQGMWAVALWGAAVLFWRASAPRMVSHGG